MSLQQRALSQPWHGVLRPPPDHYSYRQSDYGDYGVEEDMNTAYVPGEVSRQEHDIQGDVSSSEQLPVTSPETHTGIHSEPVDPEDQIHSLQVDRPLDVDLPHDQSLLNGEIADHDETLAADNQYQDEALLVHVDLPHDQSLLNDEIADHDETVAADNQYQDEALLVHQAPNENFQHRYLARLKNFYSLIHRSGISRRSVTALCQFIRQNSHLRNACRSLLVSLLASLPLMV